MKKVFEKYEGKRILILGFGREGQSTFRVLRREFPSYHLFVADIKDVSISDENVTPLTGKSYLDNLSKYDYIIKTPGIPYGKELLEAKDKGVGITSQTKIFFERCEGMIIGVTGTKGKSTTSTLIYQILKNADIDSYLVGNIENPSLEILAASNNKNDVFVYELSSHQLADLTASPHIAVVTNVGVDHLDWHKTVKNYFEAKTNIVRFQKASDFAVLNEENSGSKNLAEKTKAKVIFFSANKIGNKFKKDSLLRGKHNLENIAAVVTVVKILGIEERIINQTLKDFRGLEHRLEWVAEVNGVSFYNDSASTNQTSVKAAINSFAEPLTLILGGYDRGINYDDLGMEIAKAKQVKKVIIIGQVGPAIIRSLNLAKYRGSIINLKQKPMTKVVENAFRNTPKGGVVLLSPAAASFDMFKDYKDRGNQFKTAVQELRDEKEE